METYTYLNSILMSPHLSYHDFEAQLVALRIEQETYLNLFLVTLVSHQTHSPDFSRLVYLLTHYSEFGGRKSANLNYIGYKDRKNILMHACQKGTPQAL